MKNRLLIITFFCFNIFVFSKSKKDLAENPLIKTVVFSGGTFDSQFPIIKMNQTFFYLLMTLVAKKIFIIIE